ncbi:MAG: DUF2089 domain-containing protein [Oscillospiraceae bacterium]|jgi:hypothetical protein|nr:DUF2089 domain-containing protein [Oscillospiraceae bacterium]
MSNIISVCPVCNGHMTVTKLTCKDCKTEVTNTFSLSKYDLLNEDYAAFMETFLKCEGNLKSVQNATGLTYAAVKKKLNGLLETLNLIKKEEKIMSAETLKNIQVNKKSAKASDIIRGMLVTAGGTATLPSHSKRSTYKIRLSDDGQSLITESLPQHNFSLSVFDIIVDLLKEQGGQARKGNAWNSRVGYGNCTNDTIVGRIATGYFGKKDGESTYDPVSVLGAVLVWANICNFLPGKLELSLYYLSLLDEVPN